MAVVDFKYRAFISYSHRDHTVARWLHGALESYRVPKRLVGRETATGVIARRVGAIFRDRDELPVASDLSGKINDALAATQFLIVLCSPASAQSKWVNQEVINFKRLKGEDSIIAVIIGGEPFASGMPGRESEECFVPALRFRVGTDGTLSDQPAEPIAADLRPDKDSKRLVKLKVLAGLLGLGLDELVRRENQRRTQRLFWLSSGMAAAMVTMGVLTVFAIQSRNEAVLARDDAERQKTQAEDLIEFMLGDLRKKLEPVGRLDVLDSVGDKALAYFGTLKPHELDPATQGRRARTLHLLGELEDARGNLDKAHDLFTEASESTAALLDQNPDDVQRRFDHAQSVFWLGSVDLRRGDRKSALGYLEQYRTMAAALVRDEPFNLNWQKESASANTNIGMYHFEERRYADALPFFLESQKILEKLAEINSSDPYAKFDYGLMLSWLSDTYRAMGKLAEARDVLLKETALYSAVISEDPRNTKAIEYRILSKVGISRLEVDGGQLYRALAILSDARSDADKLEALEQDNETWKARAAVTGIELGETLYFLGRHGEALTELDRVAIKGAELIRKNPDEVNWQVGIFARSHIVLARALIANGALDKARSLLDSTSNNLDQLSIKYPDELPLIWMLAQYKLVSGDQYKARGLESLATTEWRAGVQKIKSRTQLASYPEQLIYYALLSRLGSSPELAEVTEALNSTKTKHPTFSDLYREK